MKVFRIDAIATIRGIATAGSVPNTNSRMMRAPSAPIATSTRMLGPPLAPLPAACSSASRPLTDACTPDGAFAAIACWVAASVPPEPKPLAPTG